MRMLLREEIYRASMPIVCFVRAALLLSLFFPIAARISSGWVDWLVPCLLNNRIVLLVTERKLVSAHPKGSFGFSIKVGIQDEWKFEPVVLINI